MESLSLTDVILEVGVPVAPLCKLILISSNEGLQRFWADAFPRHADGIDIAVLKVEDL